MKLTKKTRDAIGCIVWCSFTLICLVAQLFSEDYRLGFLMLFSLIMFLNEDKEYKERYPEKKENNQ